MAEEALALHRRTTARRSRHRLNDVHPGAKPAGAARNAEAFDLAHQGIELRQRAYGQRHQLVAISFEFLALMHGSWAAAEPIRC
jgi:hypothetical protein